VTSLSTTVNMGWVGAFRVALAAAALNYLFARPEHAVGVLGDRISLGPLAAEIAFCVTFVLQVVIPGRIRRGSVIGTSSSVPLAIAVLLGVAPVHAQSDSASLHATLRGWAEETWVLLEDRDAAVGGRFSDAGMLQRFHPGIDAEYELDVISSRFGLSDEYAWQRRASGARHWAGSVNQRDLVAGTDFKVVTPLGGRWVAQATFNKEDSPSLARNLLRVRFTREWSGGAFAFLETSLHSIKPDNDVTVGAGWRGSAAEASVALTVLDAFSDFIHQKLEVWPGFADTALDYERQPLAMRASFETSLATRVRLEGYGAVLLPSRVRAYLQLAPDSGFRQEDRFAFLAGLIEWSASPHLRTGLFATYVRAATDRRPLELSRDLDDYRLVERSAQAGGFAVARLSRYWFVESWLARRWRPERRVYRSGAAADVDYEDRAWSGQSVVMYRATRGFTSHLAFEIDIRDVVSGDGHVPRQESLGRHNTRVRFDVGWSFKGGTSLLLGYRIDLDGDDYTDHGRFDGAHGRLVIHW